MITLRTLKKRSKEALPIMRRHYPHALAEAGEVFLADRGENYHGLIIRCTHGAGDPCRVEGRPRCGCTWHPLKGTPMVGAVSGYYEPEWDERTLFEALIHAVQWHDQPATMTDKEWRRTLAITGTSPFSQADVRSMFGHDEDESDSTEALASAAASTQKGERTGRSALSTAQRGAEDGGGHG